MIGEMEDRYRHIRFFGEAVAVEEPRRLAAARPRAQRRRRADAVGPPSDAVEFLAWLLHRSSKLDPRLYRPEPLQRRLGACLRTLRAATIAEARARLEREPHLLPLAAGAVLIGVTEFFRDAPVFRYLDECILPDLAGAARRLSTWSVGCSDGAELYSLAMLLARRGLLAGSRLLGTDCRAEAVAGAARGWYDAARLAPIEPRLRQLFFSPERGGWRIDSALRRAAQWRRADALAGPGPSERPFDLILCRNLAIYLQPSAAAGLWRVLAEALRPGGVLVLGKAERPEGVRGLLRRAPCVFQKREQDP